MFEVEQKKLAAKIEERKRPFLEKRDKLLKGDKDFEDLMPIYDKHVPELATIVAGIQKTDEEKEDDEEEEKKHEPTNVDYLKEIDGIPDYWVKAIEGHPMLQQIITDKDKPILKHVTMVKAEKIEDPVTLVTIEMFFSENEYFKDASLKFSVRDAKDDEKPEEVIGQIINWNEGKDVTKKKIKKKQKNKKTKETRTITKTVPDESFFNVFESKKIPDGYDEKDGDEDSEEEKTMQALDEANDAA